MMVLVLVPVAGSTLKLPITAALDDPTTAKKQPAVTAKTAAAARAPRCRGVLIKVGLRRRCSDMCCLSVLSPPRARTWLSNGQKNSPQQYESNSQDHEDANACSGEGKARGCCVRSRSRPCSNTRAAARCPSRALSARTGARKCPADHGEGETDGARGRGEDQLVPAGLKVRRHLEAEVHPTLGSGCSRRDPANCRVQDHLDRLVGGKPVRRNQQKLGWPERRVWSEDVAIDVLSLDNKLAGCRRTW